MQRKEQEPISLPENYYGIADEHTSVVLPGMITCMGICITSNANKKAFVHYADIPGFPLRDITEYIHPLPEYLQAFQEYSHFIFKFLLCELRVERSDIKNVTVFGNYRSRIDIFPVDKRNDNILSGSVKKFISDELEISSDIITVFSCRNADVGINSQGHVSILPDKDELLDQISLNNYKFDAKTLVTNNIGLNFNFFNASTTPKIYFKDDQSIEYTSKNTNS